MNILYQTTVSTVGGRNGRVVSDDGKLDLRLAKPKELGGSDAPYTNPEQLFAAGYAACFDSALAFVAAQRKAPLSASRVQATVGIGPNGAGGFALAIGLEVHIDGLPHDEAQALMEAAHQVCPYSNAVKGSVDVRLSLV